MKIHNLEILQGDCMVKNLPKNLNRSTGQVFSCLACNSKFWRKPSAIKKGNNKYCSKGCYLESQKGTPKNKAFKDYCSTRKGANNPNWKGGVTKESVRIRTSKKYSQWRYAVLKRDGYQCRDCGMKKEKHDGNQLHAHHIQSFAEHPDLIFDVENGLSLCKKCHHKAHGRLIA